MSGLSQDTSWRVLNTREFIKGGSEQQVLRAVENEA